MVKSPCPGGDVFIYFVLKVQACYYGHTPQLVSELVVFVISEKPEGVVGLHLPIGPFKKRNSMLEPVTRFELSIYQSNDLATVPSRPVMVFIQWVSYPVLVSSHHEDLGWSQYRDLNPVSTSPMT